MTSAEKLSTGPSRTRARGLDVDGNINIPGNTLRPRAHACTWREACKAADYVLEHFGNPLRDRGIWVWYCQRLGLNQFLDLADEVISSARQGEQIAPDDPDSLPKAYPLAEGNREATATVVPKTSLRPPCAPSVANQFCLATKGAQRGTKVFRVGAPPQTTDPECDPLTHKSVLMVSYRHAKSTRQILRHERRANRRNTRAGTQNRHRQDSD